MTVEDRVIRIIAEQAMIEPSDVALTDTMQDLGIDSMGLVECIFALEEEFEIEVPFNANEPEKSDFDISSVQTVVAGVEGLIARQKA
ncbi:acyl carrier protein [Marivita geojedonensis]|uniref:Phosphopantetheine-binding protein n=1 Tax=Marivita geojedonensis TaxID=1123756 RepID=A0A1X4NLT2_9RHOB|nr:phosphopantetheine-binding protein [Marivita geojedonensis]OSQ51213.1 phosphopantetheine-binding protein [Marivita geojedonensis]PRY78526.1 acyl carrier protein [Marivita geojedonensis]